MPNGNVKIRPFLKFNAKPSEDATRRCRALVIFGVCVGDRSAPAPRHTFGAALWLFRRPVSNRRRGDRLVTRWGVDRIYGEVWHGRRDGSGLASRRRELTLA